MAMTLDKNGQLIPLDEGPLTEEEKILKEYTVNVSIPLVVDGRNYKSGAKVDVNQYYALMDTPININIECIYGYDVEKVDIYVKSEDERYLEEGEYMIQDNGTRTKLVSFLMPMGDVDVNIILKKE